MHCITKSLYFYLIFVFIWTFFKEFFTFFKSPFTPSKPFRLQNILYSNPFKYCFEFFPNQPVNQYSNALNFALLEIMMTNITCGRWWSSGRCHKSTQTNAENLIFEQNNYGDKGWKWCVGEDMYWNMKHSLIVVRECYVPKKHNWWSS